MRTLLFEISRFSETQFPLFSSPLTRAIIFLPPLVSVAKIADIYRYHEIL
jgi:hypothetical protein